MLVTTNGTAKLNATCSHVPTAASPFTITAP